MNSSVYRVSLDIHKAESQAVLDMKKRDTDSRQIQISLTENGKPYRLTSDCSAVFSAKKPDGTVVYNDCFVSVEGNVITYDVTSQTTAAVGIVDCEIRLYNNEGKFMTSPRFTIIVNEIVCDDDDIISTDEVNALQKLINEVSDIIEAIKNGESTHTHSNKNVLDKLGINENNELQFDGNPVASQSGLINGTNPRVTMAQTIALLFENDILPSGATLVVSLEPPDVASSDASMFGQSMYNLTGGGVTLYSPTERGLLTYLDVCTYETITINVEEGAIYEFYVDLDSYELKRKNYTGTAILAFFKNKLLAN